MVDILSRRPCNIDTSNAVKHLIQMIYSKYQHKYHQGIIIGSMILKGVGTNMIPEVKPILVGCYGDRYQGGTEFDTLMTPDMIPCKIKESHSSTWDQYQNIKNRGQMVQWRPNPYLWAILL